MLFQRVLLLYVAIGDVTNNQIDFLECVARVLQLLPRLSILLVHILRHEVLLLLLCHSFEALDFCRFNHVVIPYLLDIKEDLCTLAMLFRQVFFHVMNLAGLGDTGHLCRLVSGEPLLLTMSCLIIEETLRVSIPSHRLHVQYVATHVFVVSISIFVFFGDV